MQHKKTLKTMFWEVEILLIYFFTFRNIGNYNINPIL
jgi:hypothetical protein